MRRLGLALAVVLAPGGMAWAQASVSGSTQITGNPNGSVVQPGIAKPPSGHEEKTPSKKPAGRSATLPNDPTLPQIAVQPSPTIGSGVPISGAGGTTKSVKGK
ncbi:hypothetical protein [Acidocella aminolytica]|jgi:hypothetical protein|uniref:Uncharacterized protein n=1 Tax=Acidocella aminolytica 101 = DSM 11237 TaxID=1120923 RepID=A0A0D6PCI8_9PROT|nr:hypothetical protein [Acidocella aminolytica]GAN78923.1 hypothetical protein Aam_011_044 [Acidocella aminolytica 101 = DSM 11237]SHE99356.1 hypothetical protein SAMN02746095_01790 [Acidocella aminolytica 101 = DSM 11237]